MNLVGKAQVAVEFEAQFTPAWVYLIQHVIKQIYNFKYKNSSN